MPRNVGNTDENPVDSVSYRRTRMQKDMIIQKLRDQGCRITKQRLELLDIILSQECSSCKEIYYKASRQDEKIGAATVYRMINTLEEIGAIDRRNMYKIQGSDECGNEKACIIEFDDHTVMELSAQKWRQVVCCGLEACGYNGRGTVRSVMAKPVGKADEI